MPSFHVIQNEWSLPPFDPHKVHVLPIEPLIAMCGLKTPQLLGLAEVCYRDNIVSVERYRGCDTSYPGVVAEHVANPCAKRYRLLDGNHRVHKLLDAGVSRHWFYVFQLDEFRHLVEEYDPRRRSIWPDQRAR